MDASQLLYNMALASLVKVAAPYPTAPYTGPYAPTKGGPIMIPSAPQYEAAGRAYRDYSLKEPMGLLEEFVGPSVPPTKSVWPPVNHSTADKTYMNAAQPNRIGPSNLNRAWQHPDKVPAGVLGPPGGWNPWTR